MKKLACLLVLLAPVLGAQQKKIVVTGLAESQIAELRTVTPTVRIVSVTKPTTSTEVVAVVADAPEKQMQQRLLREVADADAIIGGPTADVIRAGKKLQWVQIWSAGVEPYLFPEMVNSDIVLTNAKTLSAPGIADHGFAMLLGLTRKLYHFVAMRPKEVWDRQNYRLLELEGKTALIIGAGGIGSHVAKRAKGFGMKTIGLDPKEFPPNPLFDEMTYPDRLDEMLPRADAVFLCAPHTAASEKMMGPRQFDLMKRGSFFIALSRGKVYDLNGLVRALDSKRLAGAGIDVTDPEPLPKGHPLWKFENVILTPHIATQGQGGTPRRMELLKDNILRFSRGEKLRNIVDKQKGW
ncbi:MAG: D-2-hydroxyacid dehydrogenase [bacterium]|nr:D-2-hydroxyacid dehydrogenase [bacterium]